MIEWQDEAFILGYRTFGENKVIVSLFTKTHGHVSGMMRQTKASRVQGVVQMGNRVHAHWKARLEEHLGYLSLDRMESVAGYVLGHPIKLLILTAASCLMTSVFPERHPYPVMYQALDQLIMSLKGGEFIETYVHFEQRVLREMGFGLKLEKCCVSGDTENLVYVSPKTGRAVSQKEGEPWDEKLLKLPAFLIGTHGGAPTFEEIRQAFVLMSHFFQQHMTETSYGKIMDARQQLLRAIEKERELTA